MGRPITVAVLNTALPAANGQDVEVDDMAEVLDMLRELDDAEPGWSSPIWRV